MKNRRKFIKTTLMATAGVLTSTQLTPVFSKEPQLMEKAKTDNLSSFPKGIVYTKENPGKWEKKVKSHLPVVTIKGEKVTVETKHGMSEKHYIVRHTIVSVEGEILGDKTFSPADEDAISTFEIKGKHPTLYATSFCNKHDLWVAGFSI